jgi:hypothetical protein
MNMAPSGLARNAIRNALTPEKAARTAILLGNFRRVNAVRPSG